MTRHSVAAWIRRIALGAVVPVGALVLASILASIVAPAAGAQGGGTGAGDTTVRADSTRPFVRGGIHDKPFIGQIAGRIAIGGYGELHARHERVDGALDEAGFVARRFNLFVNSRVSDVVRFGAELEFEDGASEIVLEFAAVDLRLHRAASLRAGIVLLPVGRFNLSHDSPLNEFTDRPLVATDLIGSALSEAAVGVLGELPAGGADGRITYELYATNGYHDGLLMASPDGVRLPAGRHNLEDNNGRPAFTGRVTWSPSLKLEIGASGYRGVYNSFERDGLRIEAPRSVSIAAFDIEAEVASVRVAGEAAAITVDLPRTLTGLYASRQRGAYVEAVRDLWRGFQRGLPGSVVSLKVRGDIVDFDSDIRGDAVKQFSVGATYRPTSDTAVKFEWVRGRSYDRFNNASDFARLLASVATYF